MKLSYRPSYLRLTVLASLCLLLAACVNTQSNTSRLGNPDAKKAVEQYTELSMRLIQQGNTTEAKKHLQRALEIDPRSADAHDALAILFQTEGDNDLADDYFRKALQFEPTKTRIRNNYAAFLFQRERYREACEHLERAAQDPFYDRRAAVYENLGVCYQRLDRSDAALAAFDRAIMLDSSSARALLEASQMYFARGDIATSEKHHAAYQQLVRLRTAPNQPQSLALGVKLARLRGDKDREASFELLLRNLFPESPEYAELRSPR